MARILCIDDAFAYLRLCDGDEDFQKAVAMITEAYTGMKSALDTQRRTFALQVEAKSHDQLEAKDREIRHLREQDQLNTWRMGRIRDAMYAHPEDEDDT